tara:strand:- start:1287 stop:1487 length:201 start_codon:yes stop_codon:yes gene_type:complete
LDDAKKPACWATVSYTLPEAQHGWLGRHTIPHKGTVCTPLGCFKITYLLLLKIILFPKQKILKILQ